MPEPTEIVILGTTGMDRNAPSQLLLAESGSPFPALECVGLNPNLNPVIVLRLAFEDVTTAGNTDLPMRKTSSF